MTNSDVKDEVWTFIQKINQVWGTEKNPDALADFFHEEIVFIGPTPRERIEGRNALIESYWDFVNSANIIHVKEFKPLIQIYGDNSFAIVTYYYEVLVESEGQEVKVDGRDMYSLIKEKGRWWAVANQFSSFPK